MSTEDSTEPQVGSVFVSNYPPYSFWQQEGVDAAFSALAAPPRPGEPLGLYLHIPFCRKRCRFCYFRVFTDMDGKSVARYLDALAQEVRLLAEQPAVAGRPLEFVYFGGGTPSFISVDHLRKLVGEIQAVLPWTGAREVAFECEPGTLTQPKLEAIRDLGITRLSLGIENFDDDILSSNGRAHLSSEILRVKPWIHELGFDQLNVDLIAGMVGETWDKWRDTVQKTIDYGADSVTIYQMELPYNTVFTGDLGRGELTTPLADWKTKREWHDYAFNELAAAGFTLSSAYTMVRKDKPGNFVYRDSVWHGVDMLGTGVASFSHMSGVHYQNLDGWGEYLDAVEAGRLPLNRAFPTTARERLTREMILQLKFGNLRLDKLSDKFAVDVLDTYRSVFGALESEGLLEVEDDRIKLTRSGLLRVDTLLPRFYDEKYRNARYT